jgi:HD superfamily phosphohydrolase
MTPARRDRHLRDPVHDDIPFHGSSATDRLLLSLVEAREVQRLRRIRQLGLAHLVFPGAEHSRFPHALGVMQVARRMLEALRRRDARLGRHETPLLAAALLHDVGHGPLSHAFEPISGSRHERWSSAIVLDEGTEVHRALRRHSRDLPARVNDLFLGQYRPARLLGDLVSSQLDADRCDYLLRDVMATGVKHGIFDLGRILLFLLPGEGRVLVDRRALAAVEGYVIARAHMYEQVYYHKTVRAAESMLRAAVVRARAVGALDGLAPGLRATLSGRRPPLRDYLSIDDGDFFAALKAWSLDADPGLSALAGGLLHRRLLKCVEIPDGLAFGRRYAGVKAEARALLARRGFDPDADLVLDESAEERYLPYVAGAGRGQAILVSERGRASPRPLEDVSDLVRRLSERQVYLVRWFCPAAMREPLKRLVARAAR